MPRPSSFPTSARLRRLLHLIVVIFVSFYIGSDVLDLDLSDFPSEQDSREREMAVTDGSETSELARSLDPDGLGTKPLLLDVSTVNIDDNGLVRILRFRTAGTQIYRRVTFPPSSTTGSPPD